ncbi:hypothetical protein PoB_004219400 [Plakobranchus ocellatus]|uniref:Secreted protein n=1 Tax=Plakobranchus ocellatus TaxID=259542 RepID=A0AAV4BBF8_9GAST|nr:hypothetical protein PoB_004219400 [Plakobranchus ocellatus]
MMPQEKLINFFLFFSSTTKLGSTTSAGPTSGQKTEVKDMNEWRAHNYTKNLRVKTQTASLRECGRGLCVKLSVKNRSGPSPSSDHCAPSVLPVRQVRVSCEVSADNFTNQH